MKTPADIANDNGKSEDHLAAATMSLHKAVKGLDAPAKLIVDVLDVHPPGEGASRQWPTR